ncbi:hypothetical protein HAX54_023764 [Datura stramonium]|uniref:Uncharacterized protein n=1 Tax=Datura stramonium TaxID=4076 RepID=A0ABS8UZD2_DATST|nr:hypothetical protein [Datura stramonium]
MTGKRGRGRPRKLVVATSLLNFTVSGSRTRLPVDSQSNVVNLQNTGLKSGKDSLAGVGTSDAYTKSLVHGKGSPTTPLLRPVVGTPSVDVTVVNQGAGISPAPQTQGITGTSKHELFLPLITSHWKPAYHGDKLKGIWKQLKDLRGEFRKLNVSEFQIVTDRVIQARSQLQNVQELMVIHCTDALIVDEVTALENLRNGH